MAYMAIFFKMILTLFASLTILSIILILIGYFLNIQFIRIIGFGFLCLVGLNALDGIQYQTGTNVTTDYSYNYNGDLNTSHDVINKAYTTFENRFFGYFLAMLGAFGMIIDLIFSWGRMERYGEEYQ